MSSPCWLDTTHWYIPLSAGVAELMVSCVLTSGVVEMLVPEGTRLPSLYLVTVASGMASMLQVIVTSRPVRMRCGPLTDVTLAGSKSRAEKHRSVQHANFKHNPAAEPLLQAAAAGEEHAYSLYHYSGMLACDHH